MCNGKCKMKGGCAAENGANNHKVKILEIELAKTKREKEKWRQAFQTLAALIQKQKHIPREAKKIIRNFSKS